MATTEKILDQTHDIVSTKTLLHEAIPLTGTIVSGTYADNNVKNYSHGMFQSVYDYPYLSSSANHVFDITMGYAASSELSNSANTQNQKKINIYNQMAQVLYGYNQDGSIKMFDADGNLSDTTTDKIKEAYFVSFSRLLMKDEIQKGTFNLTLNAGVNHGHGGGGSAGGAASSSAGDGLSRLVITDSSGSDGYLINSPVGEYGVLFVTASNIGDLTNTGEVLTSAKTNSACGLIFYQAGVMVLTASLFASGSNEDGTTSQGFLNIQTNSNLDMDASNLNINNAFTASAISGNADNLRHRIESVTFNNTVELNSTIFFCRINHNEFNYSSNPTYLTASEIRVKNVKSDPPVSYITSIGLYDAQDRLLACGKLSEPLRKDPTIEYTLRARLDY